MNNKFESKMKRKYCCIWRIRLALKKRDENLNPLRPIIEAKQRRSQVQIRKTLRLSLTFHCVSLLC